MPCHFATPDIEAQSDEESSGKSHAAHEDARDDVNEGAEEAAVLVLVEEHADPVDLCGGDDEHDHAHEDGEVAVGLTGPVHHKLSIPLSPLPRSKQQTMTLNSNKPSSSSIENSKLKPKPNPTPKENSELRS